LQLVGSAELKINAGDRPPMLKGRSYYRGRWAGSTGSGI